MSPEALRLLANEHRNLQAASRRLLDAQLDLDIGGVANAHALYACETHGLVADLLEERAMHLEKTRTQ